MYNRKYDRKFFILKQDSREYSLQNMEAEGNMVMELRNGKGKINSYIKGLKPLSKDMYKVYLIAADDNESLGVGAGLIAAGKNGQGEAKWEFDPDDVGGSGKSIEAFNVAAIVVKKSEPTRDLTAPLVCFMDQEINWRKNFSEFQLVKEEPAVTSSALVFKDNPEQKKEEVPAQKEPPKPIEKDSVGEKSTGTIETKSEKEQESEAELVQENKESRTTPENSRDIQSREDESKLLYMPLQSPESDPPQAYEGLSETAKNALFATEEDLYHGILTPDERLPHQNFYSTVQNFKEGPKELGDYALLSAEEMEALNREPDKTQYAFEEELTRVSAQNTPMNPFPSLKGVNWVRISEGEMVLLPMRIWRFRNHPFISSGYRKYKHYILGTQEESSSKKYYFGVPDTYSPECKKKADVLGFTRFKCCDDKMPEEGEHGYWIMEL